MHVRFHQYLAATAGVFLPVDQPRLAGGSKPLSQAVLCLDGSPGVAGADTATQTLRAPFPRSHATGVPGLRSMGAAQHYLVQQRGRCRLPGQAPTLCRDALHRLHADGGTELFALHSSHPCGVTADHCVRRLRPGGLRAGLLQWRTLDRDRRTAEPAAQLAPVRFLLHHLARLGHDRPRETEPAGPVPPGPVAGDIARHRVTHPHPGHGARGHLADPLLLERSLGATRRHRARLPCSTAIALSRKPAQSRHIVSPGNLAARPGQDRPPAVAGLRIRRTAEHIRTRPRLLIQ
ncbi:UNVERIFIED_CONTAM: hypothetical protein NCL1_55702 [Trichonephila clavipes]